MLSYKLKLVLYLVITSTSHLFSQKIDSLVIYPDTIDIERSSRYYELWTELIATNPSYSLNLGDFVTLDCNENGYNELYCSKWYDEIGFNAVIFELDSLSNFNLIYNFT